MPYKDKAMQNEVNRKSYHKYKEDRKAKKAVYLATFPEVRKETLAKSYQKRKDVITNSRLIAQYGITLDDYNVMLYKQDGCCKVCSRHHLEFKKSLSVDHVHGMEGDPNGVRGLLCTNCNTGIGKLGDNIEGLETATQYLKDYENKT
jgi:hypothetical protein